MSELANGVRLTSWAVFRASCLYPADPELELSTTFNPLSPPEEIGGALLRLARASGRAAEA